MCGRYTLYQSDEVPKRFGLSPAAAFVSVENYNVAPSQRLPVICRRDGSTVAQTMQWGFLPVWSKNPAKERRPINTRAESALSSRYWRQATLRARCIVPARGFYEWKAADIAGAVKVPYYIRPSDQELFGFAGIYSVWHDAEQQPLYSFSIITTAANADMAPIHDRMPVILHPDQEALWLDETLHDEAVLHELMQPYPDGKLTIVRVSSEVNSPRHNHPQLFIPI